MKGDEIPKKDCVARLCKPSTIENQRILAAAFMLRLDEESLSVNWLEKLDSTRSTAIDKLRRIYASKFPGGIKVSAKIAVVNVGEVLNKIEEELGAEHIIKILHNPTVTDESHAGIYNIEADNHLIIAELISSAIQEDGVFQARE
jgi:hypothetical protein